MEIPLLKDILIIFGLSIAVVFICHRLRVPAIVGYLLTGVLAGPHGLGLIARVHEVEILAEVGVVLLLFTVGIEFSLRNLLQIKRSVLIGGSFQVLLTLFAGFILAEQFGQTFGESLFIGFLISLSSTAIVLKLLQDRAEIDSPHGQTSLAILIFQDVIIVPMMLFTPLLTGATGSLSQSFLILSAKGIGIVLLVFIGARWIVPQLMYQIARTRSRELFLLSIVVICLAVAWLTHRAGLSLALGAFLAGLIISESEYGHQALGSIVPFRDVFTSFFFISIGMLLSVAFVLQRPGLIALIAFAVLTGKAVLAACATMLLGFPLRTTILVGLALCQIGEFSFILSKTGVEHGLLAASIYQLFLAVSVLTMAVTPFIIALAPRITDAALRLPLPRRLRSGLYPVAGRSSVANIEYLRDHLIIIGFGLNGRNVARSAKVAGIQHVIIEINPETVRTEKSKGEPIFFGDATQEAVLKHAKIETARVLVAVISDPTATRRIIAMARRLNPKVHVIARSRFLQEMRPLYELGANEVIPEEFETSVEIFTRVLIRYLIPRDEIEKFSAEVRADGYEIFRSASRESTSFSDLELNLPDIEISSFRVSQESAHVGKTLAEIELRKKYGVTLLALRRDSEIFSNPDADTRLRADDVLVLLGQPSKIAAITSLFHNLDDGKKSLLM
ncbi:MAG: cation:proton antiporter [Deltaproteobacteria bacterium]|nr:MAG: cation:proton antiporter [Deltaproteobacteria bacterium]